MTKTYIKTAKTYLKLREAVKNDVAGSEMIENEGCKHQIVQAQAV